MKRSMTDTHILVYEEDKLTHCGIPIHRNPPTFAFESLKAQVEAGEMEWVTARAHLYAAVTCPTCIEGFMWADGLSNPNDLRSHAIRWVGGDPCVRPIVNEHVILQFTSKHRSGTLEVLMSDAQFEDLGSLMREHV